MIGRVWEGANWKWICKLSVYYVVHYMTGCRWICTILTVEGSVASTRAKLYSHSMAGKIIIKFYMFDWVCIWVNYNVVWTLQPFQLWLARWVRCLANNWWENISGDQLNCDICYNRIASSCLNQNAFVITIIIILTHTHSHTHTLTLTHPPTQSAYVLIIL